MLACLLRLKCHLRIMILKKSSNWRNKEIETRYWYEMNAVINFIHAYDPEVVILGGGIMNSHKVIVPYIEERVSKFAWTPSAKVSVVVSSLGDYAALYGLEYCLRKKIKDEVFC